MAFSDNPRVQPLKDGAVKPQGIDLNCVTIEPGTLFFRDLMYDEFDVSKCRPLHLRCRQLRGIHRVSDSILMTPQFCLARGCRPDRCRNGRCRRDTQRPILSRLSR